MGQYAYIRVRFPGAERPVYMDGGTKSIGSTNKRLRVRTMFHEFDLGAQPPAYTPPLIGVRVDGSPSEPTEIVFSPPDAAGGAGGGDGDGHV